MAEPRYSMAELEQMFQTPQQKIHLRMVTYETYEAFVAIVNDAVDLVIRMIEENPKYKQKMSEDQLTILLVEALRALGLPASHDSMIGGHCDVVIRGRNDYTWLGEAKIHSSYDWLLKGFEQLDSRYMAPASGRDHGGIIIYCYGERADLVLDEWIKHLLAERLDVNIITYDNDNIRYETAHEHARNGRIVKVRHSIASLHFAPQDKAPVRKPRARKVKP